MTWPQPPPTPTLEWREVEARVAEVMDQCARPPPPNGTRDGLYPGDQPSLF